MLDALQKYFDIINKHSEASKYDKVECLPNTFADYPAYIVTS
jgi:hypothetical protein